MEDAHVAKLDLGDGNSFFAVFDGHGGPEVASYASKHLVDILLANESYKAQKYEAALKEALMTLDEQMRPLVATELLADAKRLQQQNIQRLIDMGKNRQFEPRNDDPSHAGSTATCVLLTADKIYCANLGDSRTIYWRTGDEGKEAVALSSDHKPDNEKEAARITAAGGKLHKGRVFIGDHGLAVSRSLGDFKYKENKEKDQTTQMVSCEAEVTVTDIAGIHWILLACDGVWDVMSPQEAGESIMEKVFDKYDQEWKKLDFFVARTKEFIDCVCADKLDPEDKTQVGTDNLSGLLIDFRK